VELRALQRRWDAFARRDPLGAILDPLQGGEERDLDSFFAWGVREIEAVLADGGRHGLPRGYAAALDFGCGAGRLTQAMAPHFERCEGVDISPAMIRLAKELNRRGERCRYRVNETDSLALFADSSFDFVYSSLVLQHMDPPLARGYIREFARVVRPGGLLVFQVPAERDASGELPWSAFRASIHVAADEAPVGPGQARTVRVSVRNDGDTTWPSRLERRPILIGNHWRDAGGELLIRDDGRASLPRDLGPGEQVVVALTVTAPLRVGGYLLEVDLVQEGIAWFAERGSRPGRLAMRVEPGGDVASRSEPDPRRGTNPAGNPVLPGLGARTRTLRGRVSRGLARRLGTPVEMNGIPRAEVLAILAAAGARTIDVVEDDAAGSGWISFRYTATKEGPQAG
jgi:SAM-dependent methyltransferase